MMNTEFTEDRTARFERKPGTVKVEEEIIRFETEEEAVRTSVNTLSAGQTSNAHQLMTLSGIASRVK